MRLLASVIPARNTRTNGRNIGFIAVDEIARRHGFAPMAPSLRKTFDSTLDRRRVVLLDPATYMNESGRAVQEAANFFARSPPATSRYSRTSSNCRRESAGPRSVAASPVTTACARSHRISATTHPGAARHRSSPASRNWCVGAYIGLCESRPAVGGGAVRSNPERRRNAGDGARRLEFANKVHLALQ